MTRWKTPEMNAAQYAAVYETQPINLSINANT
jgi:hypothetical protein